MKSSILVPGPGAINTTHFAIIKLNLALGIMTSQGYFQRLTENRIKWQVYFAAKILKLGHNFFHSTHSPWTSWRPVVQQFNKTINIRSSSDSPKDGCNKVSQLHFFFLRISFWSNPPIGSRAYAPSHWTPTYSTWHTALCCTFLSGSHVLTQPECLVLPCCGEGQMSPQG